MSKNVRIKVAYCKFGFLTVTFSSKQLSIRVYINHPSAFFPKIFMKRRKQRVILLRPLTDSLILASGSHKDSIQTPVRLL
jgi:hypothetical protein